ncbi:MAG TPA: isoprenylcysteine carboxylmethyltransferase family protein [Blastocatellia bacterium]|nr:isoprenylcysteine carboxylmethyltransferase family protein [Blastocatellia bacterium]
MMKAESNATKAVLQRLRVPLGFLTAIVFVIVSRPSWRSLMIGVPVALCGVAIRAWASGHLRKNAELAVSGPYAYTRNPLYLGSFVMAVGCAICGGNWWIGAILIAFFLLIYIPVMQAEAAHMHHLFPNSFAAYERRVPLLFPRLTPYEKGEARNFDSSLYLKYREYRALIGLSVVIGILVIKALWIGRAV